jgi:hypothetical protein
MNKKLIFSGIFITAIALLFVSCAGPKGDTGPAGPVGSNLLMMTLQDGQAPYAGYTGIVDAYIDSANASTQYSNTGYLYAGYWTGSGSSTRPLMKIDMSPLVPATAVIVKAYLTLTIFVGSGNYPTITAYKVSNAHILTVYMVTWLKSNMMDSWTTPGGDYDAAPASDSVNMQNTSNNTVTFTLDPSLVQSWLSSSSTNNGIILKSGNENLSDGITEFYDSTAAQVYQRPKLTVYYRLP